MTNFGEHGSAMLNWFVGGPHDNELWTVEQLLYKCPELPSATWIVDYVWTDETVTGSESGRVARVWRYVDAH